MISDYKKTLKSKDIRDKVWSKSKGICSHCNRNMLKSSAGSRPPWDCEDTTIYVNGLNSVVFSIDHIKPVSRGGSNKLSNLQGLCITCNKKKKNKDI